MLIILLLIIPLMAATLLLFLKAYKISNIINISASLLTFGLALFVTWQVAQQGPMMVVDQWFYVDHFSVLFILITTFISTTTAIFSVNYLKNEQLSRTLSQKKMRFYFSLYQIFFFVATLVLISNNLGIVWVGMECATLITVLLVSCYRTPRSLEAAWKYLILCGLGLAQALLGTILVYFSAESVLDVHHALLWTELDQASIYLSAPIVSLAFVFILIGYGTKAGFVPLHHWLPDAYGESMAPVLSLLSGVFLNLAMYAILRFKMIADDTLGSDFTNPFLLGFGLLNVTIAAFFIIRQREMKRLYAYSSIEHMGLISFAFGIGTPLAIFAGLLHILAHALSKTATFFSVGHVIQLRKQLLMENIYGLANDHPGIAWGLLLSSFSLLGLPPFALFISEFLIIYATIETHMGLALPLIIAMVIAFAGMLYHVQHMVFYQHENSEAAKALNVSMMPTYLHLLILVGIGVLVPVFLKNGFYPIIQMMGHFV